MEQTATHSDVAISLAKLMKLKSRLAGRLAAVQLEITTYNSIVEGTEAPNTRELYLTFDLMSQAIVKLKLALDEGNRGQQRERILTLAEKKGKLTFIRGLNTRHGEQRGYSENVIKYVATIRKTEVDETARTLECQIDELQDQIDGYNASRTVTVDAGILSLVS